jgi:hypothetical protein
MFPRDYLIRSGYKELVSTVDAYKHPQGWESPTGDRMSFEEARKEAFGSCPCCGKPNAYPGAVRCGAACTAMHEGKDCNCYKQKRATR